MVSFYRVGHQVHIHQIVLKRQICVSAGTASVIIALTDGELNEWQFDSAQREVRRGDNLKHSTSTSMRT